MKALLSLAAYTPTEQKRCYWSAIAMYVLILVLGSIPGAREDLGEVAPGVILHSVAYAVLALLLFVGSSGKPLERAVKSLATIAAMGAFDEYVQSFLPYREASAIDWMVDVLAGAIVCTALSFLWPRQPGR